MASRRGVPHPPSWRLDVCRPPERRPSEGTMGESKRSAIRTVRIARWFPTQVPIAMGCYTHRMRNAHRFVGGLALFAILSQRSLPAQKREPTSAMPAFEVASVKPNKSGDQRTVAQMQPGGRFTATNISVRLLIRNAFRMQDSQIVG